MKLVNDVFSLLPGNKEAEVVEEILVEIGVKHKHTLTRRNNFSPAEQKSINSIFARHKISPSEIWHKN